MDKFDNMVRGRRGRVSDLSFEPDLNPLTALLLAAAGVILLTMLVTATAIMTAGLFGVK